MHCLQTLAEDRKEVMFVISQLSFGDYLHKPCYTAAAKHLPRPSDLPESYRRGDFDVIIIHRHYGLLIGEIKAIGLDDAFFQKVEADREADIANRVLRAIKQLNKSETVVKHLISDVAPSVSVRKTLILPYITRSQLLQVLDGDDQLEKALRDCLGASSGAGAVQMCLCSDQMSAFATPWDVTEDVLSHLSDWWERRLACSLDPMMSSTIYLDLIVRSGSYAVSHLIFYQLQKTLTFLADTMDLPNVVGAVHFHHFDLQKRPEDVHVAVNTLLSLSQNRRLQVLMDEALFGDEKLGSVYNTLIDDLASSVNRLCLWAATVSHANTPQGLQLVRMTLPLRSAPVVLREVEKGIVEAGGEISSYTSSGTLPPSDGPRVISLRHHGEDHAGRWPVDCYECGLEVAKVLKDLHVGDSAGLPVGVVSWKDDADKRQRSMAEVAVAGKDEVIVCDYRLVNGLERKVVVHLPGRVKDWDDKLSDDDIQLRHWLYSMSRCSTQLVLVEA
nr:hypothetical protein BaRGS_034531 [Batillaria attramentaria]